NYDIVEATSRCSSEHQEGREGREEETHHCSLAEEDSHGAGKGGRKGSQEERKALVTADSAVVFMKAIVYRDCGSPDVLKPEEVDKPVPGDAEVLVAVRAAAVNMLDWYMVRGKPALIRLVLGVRKPKRLGFDMAGTVEAIGRSITRFKPGDEIFGKGRGAFAA